MHLLVSRWWNSPLICQLFRWNFYESCSVLSVSAFDLYVVTSPTVSCPLTKAWPLERNPSPLGLLVWRWHQDSSLRLIGKIRPGGGVTFEARAFDVAPWLLCSQELKDESLTKAGFQVKVVFLQLQLRSGPSFDINSPKYDGPLVVVYNMYKHSVVTIGV